MAKAVCLCVKQGSTDDSCNCYLWRLLITLAQTWWTWKSELVFCMGAGAVISLGIGISFLMNFMATVGTGVHCILQLSSRSRINFHGHLPAMTISQLLNLCTGIHRICIWVRSVSRCCRSRNSRKIRCSLSLFSVKNAKIVQPWVLT